jgi:hypothetical protein
MRREICVKNDGSTGFLLTSDYLRLGLIFAFIVSVKSLHYELKIVYRTARLLYRCGGNLIEIMKM